MGGGQSRINQYEAGDATSPEGSFAEVVTEDSAAHFSARWDNVLEWESINTPASRQGLALLLQIDREQRCDPWLWRPLHYVALYGLASAAGSLVDANADVDARTGGPSITGRTLTKETFNFCSELECLIRGRPVRVRAEEVSGESLTIMKVEDPNVRWTTTLGNCRCVDYSPINPPAHLRHFSHVTPLHIAIEFQHMDTIKALLKRKADANLAWNQGRNMPLHTAIWQGHYKGVSELLRFKADANRLDSWSRTPLATAAICPKKPPRVIAVMLLESGAKRAATDSLGKTAAQLARESDNDPFADAVEAYVLGGWKDKSEKQLQLDLRWPGDSPRSRASGSKASAAESSTVDGMNRQLGATQFQSLQPQFAQAFARITYHPPPIASLLQGPALGPYALGGPPPLGDPPEGLDSPPASGEPTPRGEDQAPGDFRKTMD